MPDVEFVRELAAIPIATIAMYFMYKLSSNHMHRLADAIDALREWLIANEKDRQ